MEMLIANVSEVTAFSRSFSVSKEPGRKGSNGKSEANSNIIISFLFSNVQRAYGSIYVLYNHNYGPLRVDARVA